MIRPVGVEDPAASLAALVEDLVADGVTATVAAVATPERLVTWAAAGCLRPEGSPRRPDLDSRFDLASLTKPIMATMALDLDADGTLPLGTRIGRLWPSARTALRRRTLGSLWRHRAGLVPWTPLALRCATPADAARTIVETSSLHGARPSTYSDLGPILYGQSLERATSRSLASWSKERMARPWGMRTLTPAPGPASDVAVCGLSNRVEQRLAARQGLTLPADATPWHGRPQDGNARFLGLAGHAGLFGSAMDLWRFGAGWLEERSPLTPPVVTAALGGRGAYALGWARRRVRGSAGPALDGAAFGHTGFVGNSLWLDPSRRLIAILLAHRGRHDIDMNRHRRTFHRLAVDLLAAQA